MARFYRYLRTAAALVAAAAVSGLLYALIKDRSLSLAYVFTANYVAGSFIILIGLVTLAMPVTMRRLGNRRLIDHTTYGAKVMEVRKEDRNKANALLFLGIGVVLIAGVAEVLVGLAS